MIIYHGGTDIVKTPMIIKTYSGRDFGTGFYTTSIREQAVKWSIRQAAYRKSDKAILNTYELDDNVFKNLNTKTFDGYTMEWLNFVVSCRQDADFRHEYDLIVGKIANDDVGETIQAVIDGLTSKDFALSKLVFVHANNQICLSTDNALEYIKFISARKVN